MRRKLIAAVSIVATIALVPLLAGAEPESYKDPNDARGRMDVKRVEVGGNDRVRYKIITFPKWKTSAVRDHAYVIIFFDTFGSKRFDYYALIGSNGSKMTGALWRDRKKKSDFRVVNLNPWRPSSRGVGVRIPIGRMKWPQARDFYKWRVQTLFSGKDCRSVCFDVVPNKGRVTVFRRGADPTPTPTPTEPSPTPTGTPP